jgi:acetylornithine/N-succinyldiaminopimelate aminotransferase
MDILKREAEVFFHTYKRIPVHIDRGEGVFLFDKEGRMYLDMFGGLAVNALGYGHRRVIEAIEAQSRKFIHLSNYYLQDPQILLAEKLLRATDYDKVFLCNSGTEAIEGTLKIARKWGAGKKSTIVSFTNAFHGRTFGALSTMDRQKYREGFGPFVPGFVNIPFNDVAALRQTVDGKTLAVLIEFIQGEGGITVASQEFVRELFSLKAQHGFLVIADEVQAGVGRTGRFFAFNHYGVRPDIVAVAKPLGGGLPLGAILGASSVSDVLQYGVHGTTFGGNPVACAAGIVVLDEVVDKGLMRNAESLGDYFIRRLKELQTKFPGLVKDVRGKGLMIGVELSREGDSIVEAMRNEGVLINCTNQTVLRFLPPLVVERTHIDDTVGTLEKILSTT